VSSFSRLSIPHRLNPRVFASSLTVGGMYVPGIVAEYSKGEYALVAWVGISTAPAWLPMTMLEKVDKLVYQRL